MSTATPAQQWKKTTDTRKPHDLTLPSGNVALVKIPGLEVFIQSGLIPNNLLTKVQKFMKDPRKPQAAKAEEFSDDLASEAIENPEVLAQVFEMTDNVTVFCVVEPKILPVPDDNEERDLEALYVDEVNLEDKMFIMQYAMGGTGDLEQFRVKSEDAMGPLASGEGVGSSPESTPVPL